MVSRQSKLGLEIKRYIEARNITQDMAANAIPSLSSVMAGGAPPEGFENALFEFFVILDEQEQKRFYDLCNEQRDKPFHADAKPAGPDRDELIDDVLNDLKATPYTATRGMLAGLSDDDFEDVKNYAIAAATSKIAGGEDVTVPAVPKALIGG